MISANNFCVSGTVERTGKMTTKNGKEFASLHLKIADRRPNGVVLNTVEISAWGKVIEDVLACANGSYCVVQGKISPRSYTDKNGEERYQVDLVALQVQCDGERRSGDSRQDVRRGLGQAPSSDNGSDGGKDAIPF